MFRFTLNMLVVYIILLCNSILLGQNKTLNFKHISVENGLSESTIHYILQDKTGLLWIGTQNGLDCFDGYDFTNFFHSNDDTNSISNNFINVIFQDKSGLLWIGTNDGLNIYTNSNQPDDKREIFYKFKNVPHDSKSLTSNIIEAIYQDTDGYIWVGTDKGLNKTHLPKDKKQFQRLKFEHFLHKENSNSLSNNHIKNIVEDKYKNLWIATLGGGLDKFDKKSGTFYHFKHDPDDPKSISSNYILTLFIDHSNNLWIGTYNGGLNKFNYNSKNFISYKYNPKNPSGISDNHVYSIKEDSNGRLWLATFNGIAMLDPETGRFIVYKNDVKYPKSLSNNLVRSVFIDRSENLWAGTSSGLNKADLKPKKFYQFKRDYNKLPTFSSDYILSFYEDGNILWIGTLKGLDKYNLKTEKVDNFKILHKQTKSKEGFVYAIEPGKKNILWLGTFGGGLYKFNTKTNSLKQFKHIENDTNSIIDSRITSLLTDHNNNLLIGTAKGISVFNKDKEEVTQKFFTILNNIRIYKIYQDKKKSYWAGTTQGLYHFDKFKKFIAHYSTNASGTKSISNNLVYTLCEDKHGNVWAGTDDGLNKINLKNKTITNYFKKDGLPSNSISAIINDAAGNFWMSTFNGVTKFNPISKEIKFKNFGLDDGLVGLEYTIGAYFKNKEGEIYFGNLEGFNKFNPKNFYTNPHKPTTIITKFYKLNNLEKSYHQLKDLNQVELSYNERFFSFEFAALDFTNPYKNKYAYKLEGFNNNWTYSNRRFTNYTNLDPGSYIFKVKGTNNDGVWSEKPAQLLLIINPPFWAEWWFRGIVLAGLYGVLGFMYKKRTNSLKKEKTAQEEFSKRLMESQENERKRIASELHDSIGQNLLIIKNRSLLGAQSDDNNFEKEQFKEISSGASSIIDEVRRISYNLHPYHLDRLGLTKAIYSIVDNLDSLSEINFNLSLDNIDNAFNKEREINFFRIIQEAVNNIVKHSKAVKADIKIKKDNFAVETKIIDNGQGFDSEIYTNTSDPAKGFGIYNMKKRVNLLKGVVEINSVINKGTEIIIKIPLKNDG